MKTHLMALHLFTFAVTHGLSAGELDQQSAPASTPDEGTIEAKVVAVNRGFGFIVVDAGSKKGVEKGMVVDILRGKKWFSGILEIGEIEDDATVLEYGKGKSDPRDRIEKVRFRKPKVDRQEDF